MLAFLPLSLWALSPPSPPFSHKSGPCAQQHPGFPVGVTRQGIGGGISGDVYSATPCPSLLGHLLGSGCILPRPPHMSLPFNGTCKQALRILLTDSKQGHREDRSFAQDLRSCRFGIPAQGVWTQGERTVSGEGSQCNGVTILRSICGTFRWGSHGRDY